MTRAGPCCTRESAGFLWNSGGQFLHRPMMSIAIDAQTDIIRIMAIQVQDLSPPPGPLPCPDSLALGITTIDSPTDTASTISEEADHPPQKRGLRLIRGRTLVIVAIVLIASVVVWGRWRIHRQQSLAVKERLTGRWTFQRTGDNATWVCEFRDNGDALFYPLTDPPPPRSEEGYFRWTTSGPDLMLSYQHHFTRNATVTRRLRQISNAVDLWWNDRNIPLSLEDHLVIKDDGGDSIVISSHPDPARSDGFWGEPSTLTRIPGDKDVPPQADQSSKDRR